MVFFGNLIAGYRKTELQQLDQMLCSLQRQQSQHESNLFSPQVEGGRGYTHDHEMIPRQASGAQATDQAMDGVSPSQVSINIFDDLNFDVCLTREQIMETVNTIDSGENEWMSRAILEHGIW